MDLTLEIKKILLEKHIQMGEFADMLKWTRQNLSVKFKKNDYRVADLERMAEALDCELSISFIPKNQ